MYLFKQELAPLRPYIVSLAIFLVEGNKANSLFLLKKMLSEKFSIKKNVRPKKNFVPKTIFVHIFFSFLIVCKTHGEISN